MSEAISVSLTELFYTRIRTKKEKRVGRVLDANVAPIEISELPHVFSWEDEKTRGYDQELKIRMQGVDRPLAEMWKFKDQKVRANWRVVSDQVSWTFFGFIHGIEEGFVDGIFESTYTIRGFKIINKTIKVKKNGATTRKRKHNNKNIRTLRRKKPRITTKDASGRIGNRARVRAADLVQLPLGRKKRIRGANVALVRDRKLGRKSDGRQPKRRGG